MTLTDQINEAAALADHDTYNQLTQPPTIYCPTKPARGYKGTATKKFKPKYLPSDNLSAQETI